MTTLASMTTSAITPDRPQVAPRIRTGQATREPLDRVAGGNEDDATGPDGFHAQGIARLQPGAAQRIDRHGRLVLGAEPGVPLAPLSLYSCH
jgi:hypothetical protein